MARKRLERLTEAFAAAREALKAQLQQHEAKKSPS